VTKALLLTLLLCHAATALAVDDPRFCGPPAREADGTIARDKGVLRVFEKRHPKPSIEGRWYRDHVIPLACGGCDSLINLQWLPEAQWRDKSKWERIVYGGRGISPGCP